MVREYSILKRNHLFRFRGNTWQLRRIERIEGELAELVREVVGSTSEILYDSSKPDGTPRKLVDVTRILSLGWKARTSLREGLKQTYAWYTETHGTAR